jgi:hypothetical protein
VESGTCASLLNEQTRQANQAGAEDDWQNASDRVRKQPDHGITDLEESRLGRSPERFASGIMAPSKITGEFHTTSEGDVEFILVYRSSPG